MPRPDPLYDFVLDGQGYILARADQLGRGGRAWRVATVGSSIARRSDTEGRYGNQPAEVEIPQVWHSWHLGYGDEEQLLEARYHYADNVDARFPGMLLPGPKVTVLAIDGSANVAGFFEHLGELYCVAGRYCVRMGLDDTVTRAWDFGAGTVATDCDVFDGQAYVGMGYGEPFWRCSDSGGWKQATALYMGYLASFKDRLWASVTKSTVKSVAANPMTGADWSGAYQIGDPGTEITSLCGLDPTLFVGKVDGLHALGAAGEAVQVTPELRAARHAANGRGARAWHGALWLPHRRGLYRFEQRGDSGNVVTTVTPGRASSDSDPVRGQITALCGDDRWLYVAMLTAAGDTYLLAGREALPEELAVGPMIWHPIARVAGARCDAMHISGLWSNPRLWLGLGANAGYIVLPEHGDNPLLDGNCSFATSGSIYLSEHSWGAPTTTKLWKSVEIEARDVGAPRYVEPWYRLDGGSWVSAGRVNVSPRQVLGLEVAGIAGNKIAWRLDFTLGEETNPIAVRSVTARAAERPAQLEVIQAVVRCADELVRKDGSRERRSGAEILAGLKRVSTGSQAVVLRDLLGQERRVLVLSPVEEQEAASEGRRAPEVLATLRMAVFAVTPTAVPEPVWFVWGQSVWRERDGDVWGN